jgi:3-mercaptopyruvate sulfurtransferase SseA
MVSPWTLAGLAVILVGVAGFLFAYTRSLPGPAAQTRASNQQGDIPFPEVPRIPLEEAKAKFDAGTALIVDTRSREEYDQSHIPNAISLPLTELNTQNPDLPRDVEIITYCT